MAKKRIDQLMVKRNLAASIHEARALIMAGHVTANGQRVVTAGTLADEAADITVKTASPYVSRGGYKLAEAIRAFDVSPAGRVCAEVGASTGGFTDVLLQNQAEKVYAIDVGYGDLAWKLRQDPRVVVMERTNARKLERLPEPVSLVVIDASFISLKLLLPVLKNWLTPTADIVTLIKPQFEAPKSLVEKGGVVKNPHTHQAVLEDILGWAQTHGLDVKGLVASPITGPAGNKEFLAHLFTPPTHPADVTVMITDVLDI